MSANVGGTGTNNWKAAPTLTLTVGAPVPSTFAANQAGASANSIPLTWSGTQGEHFRVLRKAGGFPTSATDAGATVVSDNNANTSATATGLAAGTLYYFSVYGKVPNQAVYSATPLQTTAGTTPVNTTSLTAM